MSGADQILMGGEHETVADNSLAEIIWLSGKEHSISTVWFIQDRMDPLSG